MMTIKFLVGASVFLQCVLPNAALVSTVGTRFILYFTESSQKLTFPVTPVQLYISTSSQNDVFVQVTAPAWTEGQKVNQTAVVTNITPKVFILPPELRTTELGSENKGVLVEASGRISVFAMNPSKKQAALCSVLSDTSLGKEYIFPSYTFNTPSQGFIGVVAHQDQTWVEVTLPQSSADPIAIFKGQSYSPGMAIRVTLNKFQVAEIRQRPSCPQCDLTGAKIKTNKSAAVFSVISLYNPAAAFLDSDPDLLVEQIVPVPFWGKTFIVHSLNTEELIRIIAGEPSIIVYYSDMITQKLVLPGDYVERRFNGEQFIMFQASGLVQVMHYTPIPPFMLLVTPLEHYGTSAQVPTVMIETGSLQENSIKIVTRTCATDFIRFNSTLLSRSKWEKLATIGFNYVSIKVPLNNVTFHRIDSESDAVSFGGFVYGKGDMTAYAAPLVIDGVRPIEEFLWASSEAVAIHEANVAYKDRIMQQSWKLKERDTLSASQPISQSTVFSISICFSLCGQEKRCVYASIQRETSGKIVCRLYDESMPCTAKTSAPGVRTYVSRIPLWEQMRTITVSTDGGSNVDQML